MKINAKLVKSLRAMKPWSQEQLSEACGLSLRTIQRLESSGNASIESVRALAAAFKIDPNEIIQGEENEEVTPFEAVKIGFMKFSDFSGTATRLEYWWFFLFVVLTLAIASVISVQVLQIASLILLLPLIAAGTRRLHDNGHSGWWQFLFLIPFGGQVAVLFMLDQASVGSASQHDGAGLDAA